MRELKFISDNIVHIVVSFTIAVDQVAQMMRTPTFGELRRGGCDARFNPPDTALWLTYLGWATSLSVNACYLAIVICKTLKNARLFNVPWYKVHGRFLPISCLLARESVIYFVLVFVMSFTMIILQSIFSLRNPALNTISETLFSGDVPGRPAPP
ncbi:hypothetical protein NEOLEDRAFT_1178837 [Neolentinus lepideus HHB14362 ss-1]|uniref:Uncharacterized protein n=1 Tax=Neolentinus lepideus HHB14362 ss-1 TaxID=1314782 RepID=A0A165SFV6_9AGAM|nr:hypothetical protein NEOLEDRAFT_1178837 [Neolentinus lepideus HHB14362 ss-1]